MRITRLGQWAKSDWSGSSALDHLGITSARDNRICYRIDWSGSSALDLWARSRRKTIVARPGSLALGLYEYWHGFRTGQPALSLQPGSLALGCFNQTRPGSADNKGARLSCEQHTTVSVRESTTLTRYQHTIINPQTFTSLWNVSKKLAVNILRYMTARRIKKSHIDRSAWPFTLIITAYLELLVIFTKITHFTTNMTRFRQICMEIRSVVLTIPLHLYPECSRHYFSVLQTISPKHDCYPANTKQWIFKNTNK